MAILVLLPGKYPVTIEDDVPERVIRAQETLTCCHVWDERNRRCGYCGLSDWERDARLVMDKGWAENFPELGFLRRGNLGDFKDVN